MRGSDKPSELTLFEQSKALHDIRTLCLTVTLAALFAGRVDAASNLKVFPSTMDLEGKDDRQGIVVQQVDDRGVTRDVTATAKLRLVDPTLAALTGPTLAPRKDGSTKLVVEHAGLTAEVPVVVKDAGQSRPVSFRLDVMPVFVKHGCNNGSCHGAARGKDGFNLSLFGFDPAGDLARLDGFADVPSKMAFAHDGERVFVGDFTGKIMVGGLKDKMPIGE